MYNEFYIIKREKWDYGSNLPEYYNGKGGFTRDLSEIKTYNDINDAYYAKRELIDTDYYRKYYYSMISM